MQPLTQLELRPVRHAVSRFVPGWSVVDALFDRRLPPGGTFRQADRNDLARAMSRGGLPLQALSSSGTERLRRDRILGDIDSVLAEVGGRDDRIDVFRARRLLDTLVSNPGGLVNVTKLATQLAMARQTVDSYLEHLERRFLVHRLSNLGARPHAQGTRSAAQKIHPVDVALSVAVLNRMGRNVRTSSELFGACLETFVANELVAQAGWSEVEPAHGFWRDVGKRGDAEVDFVMTDDRGRWVGIEVKAATSVHPRDAAGLLAMAESRGLHRGFVIYQGIEWVELAEDIWGMPLGCLSDPGAWPDDPPARPTGGAGTGSGRTGSGEQTMWFGSATPPAASLFVSYVHADDEYDAGAILQLVGRLAEAYVAAYGEELEVFVDRHDLRWGEEWVSRIDAELDRTSLLLAVVTPRYLLSEQCRREVVAFTTATHQLGEPKLVLPLLWRPTPRLITDPDDAVVKQLTRATWEDVADLRFAEPGSVPYRQHVEALAERLHTTVTEMQSRVPEVRRVEAEPEDLPALDELAEQAEIAADAVAVRFGGLTAALNGFAAALVTVGTPQSQRSSARHVRAWATRAGDLLAPSIAAMQDEVAQLRASWTALDGAVTQVLDLLPSLPGAQRTEGIESLFSAVADLRAPLDEMLRDPEIVELGTSVKVVAATSRGLRPAARATESAITLMQEIQASIATWELMGSARR